MLLDLQIRDFALIEELHLTFEKGLHVLSGETGAGKSIVIDAVAFVLGGRASVDMIRSGAQSARVEAVFDIAGRARLQSLLDEKGLKGDGGLLILRREFSSEGRSRCRVNDVLVTVGVLAEIGEQLVDIHGQHEHQSILKEERQRALLDAYGGEEGIRLVEAFGQVWEERSQTLRAISELQADQGARLQRQDMLAFQVQEIQEAAPKSGEDEALQQERDILAQAERLLAWVQAAHAGTGGEQGAVDALGTALAALQEAAQVDPRLKEPLELIEGAQAMAQEAAHALVRYAESVEADPQRLAVLEERLALLDRLKRKYGGTLAAVLEHLRAAQEELAASEDCEGRLEELQKRLDELNGVLQDLGSKITQMRKRSADRLGERVAAQLAELAMPAARFQVEMEPMPEGNRFGFERIRFVFSANEGEPPRPLARIASGGEMSRVMLALKSLLAEADDIPLLIFDEVDSGIGGATAKAVAERLAALARGRQVVSVTHLAQIAAAADVHLQVRKGAADGRTQIAVERLGGEQRVAELARMLDGTQAATTLMRAREMLQEGLNAKNSSRAP